jgi:hypothetical protein
VEDGGGEDGLYSVSDGVTEVDEVAQAGNLAFVGGDDVGFDGDRAGDDAEEDVLGRRAGGESSS